MIWLDGLGPCSISWGLSRGLAFRRVELLAVRVKENPAMIRSSVVALSTQLGTVVAFGTLPTPRWARLGLRHFWQVINVSTLSYEFCTACTQFYLTWQSFLSKSRCPRPSAGFFISSKSALGLWHTPFRHQLCSCSHIDSILRDVLHNRSPLGVTSTFPSCIHTRCQLCTGTLCVLAPSPSFQAHLQQQTALTFHRPEHSCIFLMPAWHVLL